MTGRMHWNRFKCIRCKQIQRKSYTSHSGKRNHLSTNSSSCSCNRCQASLKQTITTSSSSNNSLNTRWSQVDKNIISNLSDEASCTSSYSSKQWKTCLISFLTITLLSHTTCRYTQVIVVRTSAAISVAEGERLKCAELLNEWQAIHQWFLSEKKHDGSQLYQLYSYWAL